MPIIALAAAFCCNPACTPTEECGSWTFSGTPSSGPPTSFPVSVAFDFTPQTCGKTCECRTDCMTQMVVVYDQVNHTYLYGGTGDQQRALSSGWTIDRVDGSGYGYYGLQNNQTFYSGWNTTGTNGTADTLYDDPSNWGPNTSFAAVDVATCYASDTCNDRILGYYYWSWLIDNNGTASEFIVAPAWQDLDTTFQQAVASWNAWAPNSGAELDGTGTTLNHAVAFPTLTNL